MLQTKDLTCHTAMTVLNLNFGPSTAWPRRLCLTETLISGLLVVSSSLTLLSCPSRARCDSDLPCCRLLRTARWLPFSGWHSWPHVQVSEEGGGGAAPQRASIALDLLHSVVVATAHFTQGSYVSHRMGCPTVGCGTQMGFIGSRGKQGHAVFFFFFLQRLNENICVVLSFQRRFSYLFS